MMLIKLIAGLIVCHFIGDYFFQSEYIATTKGSNWYHLLVHCVLYTLPFCVLTNDEALVILFVSHFIVDALKARYKKISYVADQVIHIAIILVLAVMAQ